MSRIDDAIRRAAELQAARAATSTVPGAGLQTAVPSEESDYPAEALLSGTRPAGGDDFPAETLQSEAPRAGDDYPAEAFAPEAAAPPVEVMRPEPVAPRTVLAPASAEARPNGGRPDDGTPAAALFDRIDVRFSEKVIVDREMVPASREQYRRLAAVLHDGQAEAGIKVIMIASAVAGEGKTLTASNLALTLSESYRRRVLLVDGDLRKPVLHSVFRLHTASGLSEGLRSADTKLVIRQVSPCLSVLPGGRPDSDPMAGLTSHRMRTLVTEAKETFDWVIIDTPPMVLLPDARLLSSMVDGVVLVVRANSTPHALVKRAVDAIGKDRIIGVVLNATAAAPAGADDYYSYSSRQELQPVRSQS